MIDLECPSCGRVGSVPKEKANSRLVCKKCHSIFHMGPTGRAVIGEPPVPKTVDAMKGKAATSKKEDFEFELPRISELNPGLLAILGLLLVGGLLYLGYSMMGGGGTVSLMPAAHELAQALSAKDTTRVVGLSSPESKGEASSWADNIVKIIEDKRGDAAISEVRVDALVTAENPATGVGQVELFIIPVRGPARNEQISREAGAANFKPTEMTTFWIYSGGRWMLDLKRTQGGNTGA